MQMLAIKEKELVISPFLKVRFEIKGWMKEFKTYSLWGSNPQPIAHKTIALTTKLRERAGFFLPLQMVSFSLATLQGKKKPLKRFFLPLQIAQKVFFTLAKFAS